MFQSIQWRLVSSYTALTLLTVVLVGLLAQFLIQRYILEQEADYLSVNATAIARRSQILLQSPEATDDLQDLARTAAFLSDVQVRILDAQQRVVADSGHPNELDRLTWIVQGFASTPRAELSAPQLGFPMLDPTSAALFDEAARELVESGWPLPGHLVVVRRSPGFGGVQHFQFKTLSPSSGAELSGPRPAEADFVDEIAAAGRAARSTQRVVEPIVFGGAVLGYVELSNGPDLGAESLRAIQRAFGIAAAGVLLLALVVALFISRGLTAPISKLATAANRMSGGDLSARAEVQSQDEIGQLADQFNDMATRLETSFASLAAERDRLRRFVADASHELRTPITALKTFNELLRGPAAGDAEAQAEFLAEEHVQLARLETITNSLLNLSRLDAGLVDLEFVRVDIGDLLATTARPFAPLASERGITFAVKAPESPVEAICSQSHVEMALSNLLDNALKFTPSGGRVSASATEREGWALIWVQDSGPGIDEAELPHIFERFHRGQESAVHAAPPGSGLGLAIVQSVAQAHGGQVSVESVVGKGSRFVVRLPAQRNGFVEGNDGASSSRQQLGVQLE